MLTELREEDIPAALEGEEVRLQPGPEGQVVESQKLN